MDVIPARIWDSVRFVEHDSGVHAYRLHTDLNTLLWHTAQQEPKKSFKKSDALWELFSYKTWSFEWRCTGMDFQNRAESRNRSEFMLNLYTDSRTLELIPILLNKFEIFLTKRLKHFREIVKLLIFELRTKPVSFWNIGARSKSSKTNSTSSKAGSRSFKANSWSSKANSQSYKLDLDLLR